MAVVSDQFRGSSSSRTSTIVASKNTEQYPGQTRSVLSSEARSKRRLVRRPRRLSFGFTRYGYVYKDGDTVPDEYLVKITSYRNNCTIVAPFQEDIVLNVESNWEPIIPVSMLRTLNIVAQVATKRSAITSSTTRRMWSGTSPMGVSLRLKFEAVEDPFVEVVEPCRLLQVMAVPSNPSSSPGSRGSMGNLSKSVKDLDVKGLSETISDLPALLPPGPSPFVWDNLLAGQTNFTEKTQADIEKSARGGDFIIIELGTFLTFWGVIIREDSVNYKTKFSPEGYPISAEVDIRFETYEMPTKESLEYSYTKIVPTER